MTTQPFQPGGFAKHLAMTLERGELGTARSRMTVLPIHMQSAGVMQGGLLVALADMAMSASLGGMLEPGQVPTTIEMKVNFLRPALLGDELVAEARVVQKGKSVAVTDVEIRNAKTGKVLLKGLGTQMFVPKTN
ncbi:MAG: PaaI family thioesterase [Chloroflexi bacterium]|nr:PaaI family thioesterase [Chloroflexota bacterium]